MRCVCCTLIRLSHDMFVCVLWSTCLVFFVELCKHIGLTPISAHFCLVAIQPTAYRSGVEKKSCPRIESTLSICCLHSHISHMAKLSYVRVKHTTFSLSISCPNVGKPSDPALTTLSCLRKMVPTVSRVWCVLSFAIVVILLY